MSPTRTFIDSHAHLTAPEFDRDREEVIARAADAGVAYIINPSTDRADSEKALALADRHPGVYAAVGIHPHQSASVTDADLTAIEDLSKHPKVVAIGEIGLDYFYDFSPRDTQQRVFRDQIDIAVRRDLPIIIHTRDSIDDTVDLVGERVHRFPEWRRDAHERTPAPRGVFHCFMGTEATGRTIMDMGFLVSFPGIITFKKAQEVAAVAAAMPVDLLMLETDSPYLSPVPHRGTRNEPSHIPLIAGKLAELQGLSIDDIARSTNHSVFRLFGVGEKSPPEIVYQIRNSLYVNLTIRCNADCVFCDRKGEAVIKGHNLRIEHEPSAQEVISAIGDPTAYDEIVFCGYGEPTIRLDALKTIARWVKEHNGRTRLNTDGHGSIIQKRNIVPELVGLIDAVSISLNSTDPELYGRLMRVDPAVYFPAMKEFAAEAVRSLPRVVMTVVGVEGVDVERARSFVEDEIGAVFQLRPLF